MTFDTHKDRQERKRVAHDQSPPRLIEPPVVVAVLRALSRLEGTERDVIFKHFGIGEPARPLRAVALQLKNDAHYLRMQENNALARMAREATTERTQ